MNVMIQCPCAMAPGELQHFEHEPALAIHDYLYLRDCALAGHVVTELPQFIAQREFARGSLRALLPRHPLPEQALNLLYPSHRHPSSIVRAYLDFCQQNVAGHLLDGLGSTAVKPSSRAPVREDAKRSTSRKNPYSVRVKFDSKH